MKSRYLPIKVSGRGEVANDWTEPYKAPYSTYNLHFKVQSLSSGLNIPVDYSIWAYDVDNMISELRKVFKNYDNPLAELSHKSLKLILLRGRVLLYSLSLRLVAGGEWFVYM